MQTISNHRLSSIENPHGCSWAFFDLPERSSIRGWPHTPASLVFENVVNLLKCFFAISFAQDSSSGEKHGSIFLERDRDGVELPSTLEFCQEISHVGKQGFENFWLLIILDRQKNLCLQLLPGWRLARAGLLLKALSVLVF